ncbi:MAG: hypothetical protein KAS62_05080 [Candidatus Delongbacteria bacterium]|nr:hypothetical protein [Candidatus Delongbacteria bacterium]
MKKKEKMICNYCGSHDFEERTNSFCEVEPYGEEIEVEERILKCKDCGEEINYTYNYTDEYENAVRKSEESSVRNILDFFNNKKIKLKQIEESLGLPIRTLSRWKSRLNYSKIGLTLLRIARSYPWIILVAARRFESKTVDEVFKQAAMKKFGLVEKKKAQVVRMRPELDKQYKETNVFVSEASVVYGAEQTNLGYAIAKKRKEKNITTKESKNEKHKIV